MLPRTSAPPDYEEGGGGGVGGDKNKHIMYLPQAQHALIYLRPISEGRKRDITKRSAPTASTRGACLWSISERYISS